LLSLAVHELRDPTAVILGYARILAGSRRGSLSTAERRELASSIERAARDLVQRLNTLSDLANLERKTLPFNQLQLTLGSVLDGVVAELALEGGGRGVSVEVTGAAATTTLRADPARLAKALKTILATVAGRAPDNTSLLVRHEPRGGASRRGVALIVGDRAAVDRISRQPVRRVRFGEGDDRLRLDGLLARRIIEAHGGQIWSTQAGPTVIELPVVSRRPTRKSAD
jgi:K+-sensing histidine kinase KdpD